MTPEGRVKKEVKKILAKRYPHLYYFMPVQSNYGSTTLDFLVCYYGYFLAIETKADGAVPTARQDLRIQEIQAAHGVVLVLNEDNYRDLDLWLDWCKDKTIMELEHGPGDTYVVPPGKLLTTPY